MQRSVRVRQRIVHSRELLLIVECGKAFARTVNRDDIRQGVEELGVNLDEHIRFVIDALRPVQREIGLNEANQAGATA